MHYLFTFVMNINIESKKYVGRKHFPLTSKDVGRHVFRYNPVKRSFLGVSAGLKSAWEGPFVITHVNSEVTCIVEGILRGQIVAYRAPIDHIRAFYDIDSKTYLQ